MLKKIYFINKILFSKTDYRPNENITYTYSNGKVIVTFQYIAERLSTFDGGKLKGFSLDGTNEAAAILESNRIVIYAEKKPEFVFYGWKSFSDGNLINSEKLPASTFKIRIQ